MTDSLRMFTLGCSHLEAPLELRERLSINDSFAHRIYHDVLRLGGVHELLILNTCNRIEIYGVGDSEMVKQYLFANLRNFSDEDIKQIDQLIFHKENKESISHALRVASGLESQILGETEILGQVKAAYRTAEEHNALGKKLNFLFQKSFQVSKWCRTNTMIGTGMVSIGNIVVDLAQRIFGKLESSSVLLVSAGEVSESVAKALSSRTNSRITVTNRTSSKAENLAAELQCESLAFDSFQGKLFHYDIVVSSTSSPQPIISYKDTQEALAKRKGRPIIFIDVAVPRDIDQRVSDLPNVFLYNIDDLAEITKKNLQEREKAAELCQKYIGDKTITLLKKLGK